MAVEILGGWKDPRAHDGSRYWHLLRNRETNQEETDDRLSLGELPLSQLVGVQVLLLRGVGLHQCHR